MKKNFEKISNFHDKHPVPKKLRTPLAVLMLLAWVAIASIGSQYIIGYGLMALVGRNFLLSTTGTFIYQVASYIMTLVVTIIMPIGFSKKAHTTREETGIKGLPTWTDIGLAPLAFVVSTLLAMALGALFSLFPWFNAAEAQELGYSALASGSERVLMFIVLVVVAPTVEEIVFRGWLYGKLRARLAAPIAILLVSALFGLVHLQWNVGVNVFAVSVVLCLLRELTGTVYSGIIAHMIKNGVAFFLVYILGIS